MTSAARAAPLDDGRIDHRRCGLSVVGISIGHALLFPRRGASADLVARGAAYLFLLLVVTVWFGFVVRLLVGREGRAYLSAEVPLELGLYVAGRTESLTIAGLVLRGPDGRRSRR